MQRIIVLAVFLALAFAQSPQNGPVAPTTIQSGVPVTSTLPITTQAANYHVDLYQLWVPENATAINITFVNSNYANCGYINLYARTSMTGGLPCSADDYSESHYSCAMGYSIDDGIPSSYSTILAPGDSQYLYEWQVDGWVYFGVGRYSSYYDQACTYTFTATINGSCPTGTISVGDSNTAACSPPYTAITTVPYVANISSQVDTFEKVYKLVLPLDVGHIYVRLNVSDTGFYLYGKNYGAPVSGDYDCYDSSYDYIDNSSNYIYDLYCYTPRVGEFYLILSNDYYAFNGSIEITYLQCPTGMGGYNCTYVSVPLNLTNPQTFSVPEAGLTDGFAYVYVDVPANYSGNDLNVVASSPQSAYLFIRYGGYPEDSSTYGYLTSYQYNSLPDSFSLNNFDYYMAGRWYFGLNCYSSSSGFCNITVGNNGSTTVTTGSSTTAAQTTTGSTTYHQSTTGSTTYYQTTTGSTTKAVTSGRATTSRATTSQATTARATTSKAATSPAAIIVPSFFAALIAIVALF